MAPAQLILLEWWWTSHQTTILMVGSGSQRHGLHRINFCRKSFKFLHAMTPIRFHTKLLKDTNVYPGGIFVSLCRLVTASMAPAQLILLEWWWTPHQEAILMVGSESQWHWLHRINFCTGSLEEIQGFLWREDNKYHSVNKNNLWPAYNHNISQNTDKGISYHRT